MSVWIPLELELDLLVSTTTKNPPGGTFEESQDSIQKNTKATCFNQFSGSVFFFLGGMGFKNIDGWGFVFFFLVGTFLPTNKSSPPQSCGRLNWNMPWRLSPFSRWEGERRGETAPFFKWENRGVVFQRW